MNVLEIAPGLWLWSAPHPNWRGATHWPEDVNCVYYEAPNATVLVDPLVPAGEETRFWNALDRDVERAGRPVVILLTVPWHKRSAPIVAERYGASVWAHEAGHERLSYPAESGPLPAGVEVFVPEGIDEGEVAFLIRAHKALVVAEFFMGVDGGLSLRVSPALQDRKALDDSLRRLLDLPIERVVVSHGQPVLHDGARKIEEALAHG
jgi:glyoxylase-like metal-dependent hydrolase (beta-lactamase superfamily II)